MGTPIEEIIRIEGGRVLATLARFTGDLALAEDAVQDAVVAALERWPREGTPRKPAAWLTTAARHRALDRIRREGRRKEKEIAAMALHADAEPPPDSVVRDDQLRLLFTCCHPALSAEARVALALRTIAGLSTMEIARAFLVSEPTMGQRISRAKRKIAAARIPYRVPPDHELPDRLAAVLAVVYVVFTAGHHAAAGRLDARVDLADEGVRLARLLVELMPDEPECRGLLALLLATHARRRARIDGAGSLVLLADQDRRLWDHAAIAEAAAEVESALRRRRPGPYQVQGAIACLHGLAPTSEATDWRQIRDLYRILERLAPSPVVRVNRAVAEAEVDGPDAALALLDGLATDDVAGWHLYWATRADLMRRLGRPADAAHAYRAALQCPLNDSDRHFIEGRLAALVPGERPA